MGQSYRDLLAWKKAMDFVLQIYQCTKSFPRDKIYGLATQMRRAAVAIPANIAEGQARDSAAEFHNFLGRARGSLVEVETEIMLAQNLQYLSPERGQQLLNKASELGKILNGLASSIRAA